MQSSIAVETVPPFIALRAAVNVTGLLWVSGPIPLTTRMTNSVEAVVDVPECVVMVKHLATVRALNISVAHGVGFLIAICRAMKQVFTPSFSATNFQGIGFRPPL